MLDTAAVMLPAAAVPLQQPLWKCLASPSEEKRRFRASPASKLRQALDPEPEASAARRTAWKTRRGKAV